MEVQPSQTVTYLTARIRFQQLRKYFKFYHQNEGTSQSFSQDISVVGDFVFVSSPGTDGVGVVYIFKRFATADTDSWALVNSIPLSLFSDNLRSTDKLPLMLRMECWLLDWKQNPATK